MSERKETQLAKDPNLNIILQGHELEKLNAYLKK